MSAEQAMQAMELQGTALSADDQGELEVEDVGSVPHDPEA